MEKNDEENSEYGSTKNLARFKGLFRNFVNSTFNYRYVTLMVAVGMFCISIGMMT